MKNKKKYYKTVIEIVVLSEEPVGDKGIDYINYHINAGDYSGRHDIKTQDEELDGHDMAWALIDQGSDPAFFQLDRDGNDISE